MATAENVQLPRGMTKSRSRDNLLAGEVTDHGKVGSVIVEDMTPVKNKLELVSQGPTERQWEHSCKSDPDWGLELMDEQSMVMRLHRQKRLQHKVHPRMAKLKSEWQPADKKKETPIPKVGAALGSTSKKKKKSVNLAGARRAKKMNRMQGSGLKRTFGGAQFKITSANSKVEPLLCGIFRQMKNKQPLCMGNVSMDDHMWKVRTKLLYYCKFGRTRKNGVVYISYASCINSFILGIHDPTKWKGQHYSARQFDKLTWKRDVKYVLKLPKEARHTWSDQQFTNFLQDEANHSLWQPMPRGSPPRVLGSDRGFYSEHYAEKMKFLMQKANGNLGERALKMNLMMYLYIESMKSTDQKLTVRKDRSMFAWLMARKALYRVSTEGLQGSDCMWDDTASTGSSTKSSMATGSSTSGDDRSKACTFTTARSAGALSSI